MKSPFASSARNRCTANSNAYPLTLLTDGHDDDATAFNSKTFVGGKGADRIEAGSDAYILLGEQGNDVLIGRDGSDFSGCRSTAFPCPLWVKSRRELRQPVRPLSANSGHRVARRPPGA
jgi:hypothetical protein